MKTFYVPEMSVSSMESYSPSAGKSEKFIDYLKAQGVQIEIMSFDPIAKEDFYLCHEQKMIDGILDLRLNNGFHNRSGEVAGSLAYTSGSFFAAAEYSVCHKKNTFSPTSGFHHAHFNHVGGYCTFNGLIITALKLKNAGLVKRVGIVDCDQHFGNGTEDIMSKLKIDWITHYTYGKQDANTEGDFWLKRLPWLLARFEHSEIIFYQAGADPHVKDPLGGSLTTEQLQRRDEIVFQFFRERKIPVVWNLAGGYQEPLEKVLEIHFNTYLAALKFSL